MVYVLSLVLAVLITAGFLLTHWLSLKRREEVLGSRPRLPFEMWYQQYYPDEGPGRELTTRVLTALSADLGVDKSQILPTDRFTNELRCSGWLGMEGHGLQGFERWLTDTELKTISDVEVEYIMRAQSVGELLQRLNDSAKQVN